MTTSQQTIVTETVLTRGNGYLTYVDEFPPNKRLSRVIAYLLLCKEGDVKSINIKYKENKLL